MKHKSGVNRTLRGMPCYCRIGEGIRCKKRTVRGSVDPVNGWARLNRHKDAYRNGDEDMNEWLKDESVVNGFHLEGGSQRTRAGTGSNCAFVFLAGMGFSWPRQER